MCSRAIKIQDIESAVYEQNAVAFHVLFEGFVILVHIFNKFILKNNNHSINQSINQPISCRKQYTIL